MSPTEYQQLVEFLGRHSTTIFSRRRWGMLDTGQGERDRHKGYAPALLIERPRILRVLQRIVRGLSWHEYHNCDFPESSVRVL